MNPSEPAGAGYTFDASARKYIRKEAANYVECAGRTETVTKEQMLNSGTDIYNLGNVTPWLIGPHTAVALYKGGLWNHVKGFFQPIPFFAPLNVIGEIATPISMAFRHYGNILSGSIISVLIAAALGGLSQLALGWLPGVLGEVLGNSQILRVGIPAVLSLYFDIFSGALQAFIFATLTMMYVSGGFPQSEFEARKAKREAKKKAKQEAKTAKAA